MTTPNTQPPEPPEPTTAQAEGDRQEDSRAEIRRVLNSFMLPVRCSRFACWTCLQDGRPVTYSGYFNDFDIAARAALRFSGKAAGVYVVMNEIDPRMAKPARDNSMVN